MFYGKEESSDRLFPVRTLTEGVTRRLRDDIVDGRIKPGQVVSQDALAAEYGVSRVPVREALRQLAAEGLIRLQSHRRAVVTSLNLGEIEELIEIVTVLEQLSIERAVPLLAAEDLDLLEELLGQMEAAIGNPREWYLANARFHRLLNERSGWEKVLDVADACRRNLYRYISSPSMHQTGVPKWNRFKRDVLKHCRNRDSAAAKATLREIGSYTWQLAKEHNSD